MIMLLLKLTINVLYMITLLLKPQNTCTVCLFQVREIFIILTLCFSETHVHIEFYNLLSLTYMIFVHSSTFAAILCQLPATNNPKTVGGMCYAIFRSDRVNIPLLCKL